MTQDRKIATIEYSVIVLIWAMIGLSPLLFNNSFSRNWGAIYFTWIEFGIVAAVFSINRFVLMPKLFFKKEFAKYWYSILVLLIAIFIFVHFFHGVEKILSLFGVDYLRPMTPGSRVDMHVGKDFDMFPHFTRKSRSPLPTIPPTLNVLVMSAGAIAVDIGLNIAVRWSVSEKKRAILKSENMNAQLEKLQSQVSPHFFMNTLNNIHALVEIDPKRAQETIIELSGLMDYLLYETANANMVSLESELAFVSSYIKLMKLRYPKRISIQYDAPTEAVGVKVPPLLFLNFIENSFKYGVDYTKDSFIKIDFSLIDSFVIMEVQNSNHSESVKRKRAGLGIANSKKRLDLLYGDTYKLKIKENEDIFSVNLKIPIK